MIITRAPFRVSFFGGGTDYPEWFKKNGGAFLSLAINKYAYITLRVKPTFLEKRYRISWRLQEDVSKISQIKHPIVRHSLLANKFNTGVDITYLGDLPGGTGVGSSSSFTVALNHALMSAKKIRPSASRLAKFSYFIERNKLKEIIGVQDQIAAAHGGFNYVKIKKDGNYTIKKINLSNEAKKNFEGRIFILYTGISRRASSVAEKQIKDIQKKNEIMLEIQNYVKQSYDYIIKEKFNDFGKLLHENWMLKKSINKVISNQRIDELYEIGIRNGAIGGKLLGAGSGGFLLFFCKDSKARNKLAKRFGEDEVLYISESLSGSEIIFKE
tara:strand:- start:388 stop:1368 length:981 start_codon:yes stop_codon:yes gene_type:complete